MPADGRWDLIQRLKGLIDAANSAPYYYYYYY
jgi:hypothetical protein